MAEILPSPGPSEEKLEKEQEKRREAALIVGLPETASWEEIKAEREKSPIVKGEEISYAEMFKPKSEKPEAEMKGEPVLEELLEELEEIEPEKKEEPTEAPEIIFEEEAKAGEKAEMEPEKKPEEEFDVEKALEEKGALEFVAEYGGDVEKLSKEDIEYLLKEARPTSNLVKGFYREEIMKDIGIELKDEDINKPLDAYFVNMKDVDPKFAESIRTNIQEFRELSRRVSDKEDQLKSLNEAFGPPLPIEKMEEHLEKTSSKLGSLGIEMGQMERKREISKSMHGIRGFFNWRNSETIQLLLGGAELGRKIVEKATEAAGKKIEGKKMKGLYEEVREAKEAKSKTVEQWRVRIDILSRKIDKLVIESQAVREQRKLQEESEKLKEEAATLKNFFFSDYFEPASNIVKIAKDRLRENLNLIADPAKTDIKTIEKRLEKLTKLSKAEIVKLGDSELREFEKKFDDLIEQRVDRDIAEKLKKLTLPSLKINPVKAIKEVVDVYWKKEKLGKKEKKEIEKMIVRILTNYIKRTKPAERETPASFAAKKVAAKSFLIKYGR